MRAPRSRRAVLIAGLVTIAGAHSLPAAAAPRDDREPEGDPSPEPGVPKRQLRAMWIASVTNIDWPSQTGLSVEQQKSEYVALLDEAGRRNLNAVIVQVRPTADAFWPSEYEPWSRWLTGTQGEHPGYDPLAFCVEAAHERNLEFHAWFNPYRVALHDDPSRLVPEHPARRHPEWVVTYGGQMYYNPGIPEVREFVERAVLDPVGRYDIDAVHFDDYFYPYPVAGEEFGDEETYQRYGAEEFPDDKAGWRRHNVNLLVREMHERVHETKPWVKFGVSPFGIWRNASTDPRGSDTSGLQSYDAIYADSRAWVRNEWLDYIVPQIYWNIGFEPADYAVLVPWWAEQVNGTHVHLYVGQAAYKVDNSDQSPAWSQSEELSRHLSFNRDYPRVRGDVYFSAKDVVEDPLGAITRLAREHYGHPALVPVMPQLGGEAPHHPVITRARRGADGIRITWRATGSGTEPVSYAVYRFAGGTASDGCDLDAAHLIATVRAGDGDERTFHDSTTAGNTTYTYVVTALDRLHHESEPSPPRTVRP